MERRTHEMSLSNPIPEGRGQSVKDFFSKSSNVLSLARETSKALTEKYLPRYEKKKKTFKLYDGIMGMVLFPHLKAQTSKLADKVRSELKKCIADKKYTKGFYDPAYLFKTLSGFFTKDTDSQASHPCFIKAKQMLINDIKPREFLEPLLLSKDMDVKVNLSKTSTSAGFKFYGRKKKHVESYMIRRAMEIWKQIESGVSHFKIDVEPFIALTRAQIGAASNSLKYVRPVDENGNVKYKGRLVWCMDAAMVLVESVFARPLINYLAEAWPNISMGKTPEQIRNMCVEMSEEFKVWFSIDFEKYDSSVPAWLIREAFDIVKSCYNPIWHRYIDFICVKFINASILMPDGRIYTVKKGIKSGSYFTQIIGSLVNALMLYTFMIHKFEIHELERKEANPDYIPQTLEECFIMKNGAKACQFMGDDNAFALKCDLDFGAYIKFVKALFGMNINGDKSTKGKQGEPVDYLKRKWTRFGEFRDEVDLMCNLMHPERKRTYENYSPWHVLFGYYMTYRGSMERLGFSLKLIVDKMRDSEFGIEAFYHLEREELPGAIAALKYSNVDEFVQLVDALILEAEREYVDIWEDEA